MLCAANVSGIILDHLLGVLIAGLARCACRYYQISITTTICAQGKMHIGCGIIRLK